MTYDYKLLPGLNMTFEYDFSFHMIIVSSTILVADNMKTFKNSINIPQLDIDYRLIAFLQFHWHVVLLNSLF